MKFREEHSINSEIEKMVMDLEPHLFFAMHDKSPNPTGFRRTDEFGYEYREKGARNVIGQIACKLKTSPKKLMWLGIHEAGGKHGKLIQKNAGHIHLVVKLPSKIAANKDEVERKMRELKDDLAKKRGPVTMSWADICVTEFNREDGPVFIQHLPSVARYMSMTENGLIDGEPFYKRPFGPFLTRASSSASKAHRYN